MPLRWLPYGRGAVAQVARIGILKIVHRKKSEDGSFDVLVFDKPLGKAATLEDGQIMATARAVTLIREAARKLENPWPCPKHYMLGGCVWPRCDCPDPEDDTSTTTTEAAQSSGI